MTRALWPPGAYPGKLCYDKVMTLNGWILWVMVVDVCLGIGSLYPYLSR